MTFGHNGLDQTTTMAVAGKAFVTGVDYTPLGDLVRTRLGPAGKQLITSHEFDEQTRRPLRTVHDQEVGTTGTERISDIRTSYDQAGNILKVTDAQGPNPTAATTDTQCFEYDYLRRMTESWTSAKADDCALPTGPGAKPNVGGPNPYWTSYTFDAVGNRRTEVKHDITGDASKDVTRTYRYAEGGTTTSKLMAVHTRGPEGEREDTFDYDAVGNTTERTVLGTTQKLEWDVEGRLQKVTEGSGDEARSTEYVYDAGGNRLIRRDPNGTTLYLPGTEIQLDKAGNIAKGTRYYQHPAGPAMVRTAQGGKITTAFLLSDHNGTATAAVDTTTGAVTRRSFTPFGEERGQKPSMWPGEKGFVGGTVDESTGLTHLGAREYDPALGRFISVDPMMDTAESQTMNPYAYANNSPVTFSDPSGQFWGVFHAVRQAISHVKKAMAYLSGGVPPAPSKPKPSVSASDVQRATWLKKQSKMDMVMHVAKEAAKKADSNGDGGGGGGDGSHGNTGAGESCRANSFTPKTKVLMADGSTKAIKDIKPGDKVVAKDPKTGKSEAKKVTALITVKGSKNLVEITIDTDGTKSGRTAKATATDGHPFWVPELRKWIKATDLESGNWLETGAGTHVQITAVKRWTQQATVHNLTVADIHTYHVLAGETPVLVHNCGEADDDLLDFADEVLSMSPESRPNVATKITSADGEHVRFAYATDTRSGAMPPQTARAVANSGHHGGCGEVGCAIQFENAGIPLEGATFQSVRIGGGGRGNSFPIEDHGELIAPCPACQRFLPQIGGRG